jgi:hypothetical protein
MRWKTCGTDANRASRIGAGIGGHDPRLKMQDTSDQRPATGEFTRKAQDKRRKTLAIWLPMQATAQLRARWVEEADG